MMKNLVIWSILMTLSVTSALSSVCLPACHCPSIMSNIMHTNCSALNLTRVPKYHQKQDQHNVTLNITFNQITSLRKIDFNMYNLIELNASHNHIETLKFPFDGQKYLHSVDLSHNRIKHFAPLTFNTVVFSLRLASNPLNMSPCTTPYIFADRVQQLDLSDTNLTSLGAACFSEMMSLTDLDLSGNPLISLEPRILDNITWVVLRGTPVQELVDLVNKMVETVTTQEAHPETDRAETDMLSSAMGSALDCAYSASYFIYSSGGTAILIVIVIFSYFWLLRKNYLIAPKWLVKIIWSDVPDTSDNKHQQDMSTPDVHASLVQNRQ